MATRFAPASGGFASGTMFAPTSAFGGGVSGTISAVLANSILSATGAVTQFWVEPFDITVNLAPTYVDTYYEGVIGTINATLADSVLYASEALVYTGSIAATLPNDAMSFSGAVGLPSSGIINARLLEDAMNFSGSHITPIVGTISATLRDAVLVAGQQHITRKTFNVRFREKLSFNVHVR